MFTGLIKEKAQVLRKEKQEGGFKLEISRPEVFTDTEIGESIAIDGICLTLDSQSEKTLGFFVGLETLAKTTFLSWSVGKTLNVERSLRMSDRIGGHIVSGHIDGTGLVTSVKPEGPCLAMKIRLHDKLKSWVVPKGSVCVNGVSLTVNEWDPKTLAMELFLIPETLKITNLTEVEPGELVNIECDSFVKVLVEKLATLKDMNELNA